MNFPISFESAHGNCIPEIVFAAWSCSSGSLLESIRWDGQKRTNINANPTISRCQEQSVSYSQTLDAIALSDIIDQDLSGFENKLCNVMRSFEPALLVRAFQIVFQVFDLGRCQAVVWINILWTTVSTTSIGDTDHLAGNLPSCSVTISGSGIMLSRSSRRVRFRNRFAVMSCSRCFFLSDSSSRMWRSRSCSWVLGILLRLYNARWLWGFSDIFVLFVWQGRKAKMHKLCCSCIVIESETLEARADPLRPGLAIY